ncbi:MAG TPA: hypothetical protein VFH68_20850 [Polyangia bacterium]|nr:hypothetical protein [Polyangia bacterium]
MFRTIGSTFALRIGSSTPRLVAFTRRFATTAIVAALVSASLAAIGCGSSSDTPPPTTTCDLAGVEAMFTAKGCNVSGCHDSTGFAAGLNLTATGLPDRLLGQSPSATAGVSKSMCAGMGKVYLNPNSNPATGLLIDKVTANPGCGVRMPLGGNPLTTSEMDCLRSWALTLTSP